MFLLDVNMCTYPPKKFCWGIIDFTWFWLQGVSPKMKSGLYSSSWFGPGFYRQAMWMKLWGHWCLKRTLLWSTSPLIRSLDLGKIEKGKHKSLVKTAIQYVDGSGKRRYKGSRALKGSQLLGQNKSSLPTTFVLNFDFHW